MTVSSTWPEPRFRPGRLATRRGGRFPLAILLLLSGVSVAAPLPGLPELAPRSGVAPSAPSSCVPVVAAESGESPAQPVVPDCESARWSDPLEVAAYFGQGGSAQPLPSAGRRTGSSR